MKYGCIGEHLGHSFSKEIHALFADYDYDLVELAPESLGAFLEKRDFCALNVTIPYKKDVIPYLDVTDSDALEIGAVNTIVNRGGKLFGYNTDVYGMTELIKATGLDLAGGKVAILGTGGTSRTAESVAKRLGAKKIRRVSRTGKDGAITYDELYSVFSDAEFLINTTPCGMFPRGGEIPAELDRLPSLRGVIDAVYNPLRTLLVLEAKKRGIPASGGLKMLVAQAIRASEHFLCTKYPPELTDKVYKKILAGKENIVLTGMPGSGKSTAGKLLAEMLSRPFIDTDELIVRKTGKTIPEIFGALGEEGFRKIESDVIEKEVMPLSSAVIATGGGAVLRKENITALRQNGRIYFLDRPLSELVPTGDRPLARCPEDLEKRYFERHDIYLRTSDCRIDTSGGEEKTAERIRKEANL